MPDRAWALPSRWEVKASRERAGQWESIIRKVGTYDVAKRLAQQWNRVGAWSVIQIREVP